MENKILFFLYDGKCPICNLGASTYKIHKDFGTVETIDVRGQSDHELVVQSTEKGFDFDKGMVVVYDGEFYQGAEALHFMSDKGSDEGTLNALNSFLFKHESLAHFSYPFMKMARNIAIKIKGVGKINNLDL